MLFFVGYISSISNKSIFIAFGGLLSGRVARQEWNDHPIDKTHFKIGQSVETIVVEKYFFCFQPNHFFVSHLFLLYRSSPFLTCSLRSSRVRSNEGSFVCALFDQLDGGSVAVAPPNRLVSCRVQSHQSYGLLLETTDDDPPLSAICLKQQQQDDGDSADASAAAVGSTVDALVLDSNSNDGIIDVTLRHSLLKSVGKKTKKSLKLGATIDCIVQLVKKECKQRERRRKRLCFA